MNTVEAIKWTRSAKNEWQSDCGAFLIQGSPNGYYLLADDEDFDRAYVVCDVPTLADAKLQAMLAKQDEFLRNEGSN